MVVRWIYCIVHLLHPHTVMWVTPTLTSTYRLGLPAKLSCLSTTRVSRWRGLQLALPARTQNGDLDDVPCSELCKPHQSWKWDEWDEGSHKRYELAHVTTKPSLATPHESSASSKHSDSRRDVRGSSEMEVPNRTMPLRREHITNTSCHCKTDFIRSTF